VGICTTLKVTKWSYFVNGPLRFLTWEGDDGVFRLAARELITPACSPKTQVQLFSACGVHSVYHPNIGGDLWSVRVAVG
jgi:hypothetical protein